MELHLVDTVDKDKLTPCSNTIPFCNKHNKMMSQQKETQRGSQSSIFLYLLAFRFARVLPNQISVCDERHTHKWLPKNSLSHVSKKQMFWQYLLQKIKSSANRELLRLSIALYLKVCQCSFGKLLLFLNALNENTLWKGKQLNCG